MPKPLFNLEKKQEISCGIEIKIQNKTMIAQETMEKKLRQKRSSKYIEAIKELDIGGHEFNNSKFEKFITAMKDEFPEVPIGDYLIGIVAKCYLGDAFDVHSLDIAGEILMHYKHGEKLSGNLERARGIAIYGGYEFIEVYIDSLRAVKSDGSVAVIK